LSTTAETLDGDVREVAARKALRDPVVEVGQRVVDLLGVEALVALVPLLRHGDSVGDPRHTSRIFGVGTVMATLPDAARALVDAPELATIARSSPTDSRSSRPCG